MNATLLMSQESWLWFRLRHSCCCTHWAPALERSCEFHHQSKSAFIYIFCSKSPTTFCRATLNPLQDIAFSRVNHFPLQCGCNNQQADGEHERHGFFDHVAHVIQSEERMQSASINHLATVLVVVRSSFLGQSVKVTLPLQGFDTVLEKIENDFGYLYRPLPEWFS